PSRTNRSPNPSWRSPDADAILSEAMTTEGRAQASLTPLPSVEELPTVADGYDPARVRGAFEAFRRRTPQRQVRLRLLQAAAPGESTAESREAEARANRLLEQARHQATDLTNSARAEVEQTLEWARAQAAAVITRAQEGTEQLLAAAGLGDEAISGVAEQ